MKYKQGGTIELGDWVKHKADGTLMQIVGFDSKCGLLQVEYYVLDKPYQSLVRPKTIAKAEPEELI